MPIPCALILRAPGANCDEETQFAFDRAGAHTERLHVKQLRDRPGLLDQFQILVIPGGFTYGDDVGAGKILANQLTHFLGEELQRFRDRGTLILGVCNGFQAILKAGLLIPEDEEGPRATLTLNESRKLEDRWVHLQPQPSNCPFLAGYDAPLFLPVAHGEGNFVCRDSAVLRSLEQSRQIVLRYVDASGQPGPFPVNPNGSQDDIAGACDTTGRILGLMPHPERHVLPTQHPRWTREGLAKEGDGLRLFRNAVRYFD
jgi:phosphoribosylformylglycinamidine synthase subunit PurQ / glutaminase